MDGDADARQVEEDLTGLTMVSEPLAPAAAPAKSPGAKRAAGSVYRKGDRIAERIEVLEMLGRGGFGVVYLVEISDVTGTGALNIASVETHECALKTFRDEYMADPQVRERFRHEAQMLVDLGRHPYLLYCQGVYEIGGQLYIATEHISPNVSGLNSLEGYLLHDPPNLAQSLRWGIQCCHGMEYAYSRGLRCHRDLKPANILIAQDRTVRLADFGLAGVLDESNLVDGIQVHVANGRVGLSGQTLTGAGIGTPTHMPPEQFTNAAACDERSDVYAFGVVLYQMATGGQLPFLAELPRDPSPAEKIRFWDEMLRLKTVNDVPQLDSPLLPIIKHCLATQPSERYQSFRELREALELLLRQTGEVVVPPMVQGLSAHDWCNKGNSLAALGHLQEAITCYDRALAVTPRDAVALNNKGRCLSDLERSEEAMICFDHALFLNPRSLHAWNDKANLLAKAGRFEEAIYYYDHALTLDVRNAVAALNKGLCLQKMGRRKEAIACFDRALNLDPLMAVAWFNKASAEERTGRLHDAVHSYERFITLASAQEAPQIEFARQRIRKLRGRR